ncbi:hypothetical protein LZ32DRAFT_599808 [Colletotrichum eremochloae]|nr:hypothetical protein LZ32DRAFT_599808 [Colletotrichum eremochloae]
MSSDTLSTEVICSVVFGTIASLLAVVGVVQNCLRKRVKARDLEHQSWYGNAPSGLTPARAQTFPH